jgi:iron complex outermembrane recepter protein
VSFQVTDESGEPLQGATAVLKSTGEGVLSDEDGRFKFTLPDAEMADTVLVRFLGYYPETIPVTSQIEVQVKMQSRPFGSAEAVVSASRFSERLLEAPASIEKWNSDAIMNSASGDLFTELNKIKDVHVVGNSLTFQVFNARGFNSSSPFRVVNLVDGMDAQSPGLNFAPGRMLGIPEIDMLSLEVITGPSSALYGPNALQGVLTMTSKDPFTDQGVAAQMKAGSRALIDAQMRVAKAFGKKERFAVKLVGSYMRADDWVASDPEANAYFPVLSPPQNLNAQVAELDNSHGQRFGDFNAYTVSHPEALPNLTPPGTRFRLPAYRESDLFDGNVNSAKAAASAHYKFNNRTRLVLSSRFAQASGVYQGNNRAVLKDFILHQHMIELRDDRFLVRAYSTFEDAGNSYDLVLTGINTGLAGLGGARSHYLSSYVATIDSMSNGFSAPLTSEQIQFAQTVAQADAYDGYLRPGSEEFNSVVQGIASNPTRPVGGRYTSMSSMQHVDAQYNLDLGFLRANAGGSWRRIDPRSQGNIFSDTLDATGSFTDISYMEFGGFLQVTAGFFKDRLRLHTSIRVDKSQNFKVQVSPRAALTFNHKGHYLRAGYQTAFRNPTLNDQYFLLNVGPLTVRGNITGYDNLYTQSSVDEYLSAPPPSRDPSVLRSIVLDPVQPERLNTFEFGYRYLYRDKLMFDASFFHNTYSGFIGSVNVVEPNNGSTGDATGVQDLDTRQFVSYSIAANAQQDITTVGASLSVKYNFMRGFTAHGSYTYADIFDANVNDDLIPGFNTPPHKFAVGVTARRVVAGFGFSANFIYVDSYLWESPFSNRAAAAFGLTETRVPSYHTLDMMVMYELPRIHSTFRLGASNIYDNRHIELWGGPRIGAMVYAAWMFDMKFK